jgi:hypothetical protein
MQLIFWLDQAETVSRRVEKFAELMQSVWTSKNDYERRARTVRLLTSLIYHSSRPFVTIAPTCTL